MRSRFSKLKNSLGLSRLKLRIISGALMVTSGILVYFSRKEPELPLTRMYIPDLQTRVTYIWQLLLLAGLLFLTGLVTFVLSFQNKKG